MRYFTLFKSLKPGAYFAFIAYLSLYSSSDILDLSLCFIRCTVEKVDSHSSCFKFMSFNNGIKDQL